MEEASSWGGRMTDVAKQLRQTWVLLGLALVLALPLATLVARGFLADVFPRCRGTLEASRQDVWTQGGREVNTASYEPLDVDRGGYSLHVDTIESEGFVRWAKMVRREKDANGASCDCGGVLLHDSHVSNAGGALWPQPDGTLLYVDRRWHFEGTAFRAVERPTHHLQRDRLVAQRHVPALVTLLSLLSLAFAVLRARRGILYATKLHAWIEARLDPSGRIESSSGETLGVLGGGAATRSGEVLVSPNASSCEKRDVYRELRIVPRADVALGSHRRWREATSRSLRDARALAILCVTSCTLAFIAHVLGS